MNLLAGCPLKGSFFDGWRYSEEFLKMACLLILKGEEGRRS